MKRPDRVLSGLLHQFLAELPVPTLNRRQRRSFPIIIMDGRAADRSSRGKRRRCHQGSSSEQ